MGKWFKCGLGVALVCCSVSALAQTITYRLDGRYPGIVSEWVEVDYSDIHPNHIDKIAYWNTSEERDGLDIVEQDYVEYEGGGAYTGTVSFPISGDVYRYAINSAGFVLSDGTGETDPAVFEQED